MRTLDELAADENWDGFVCPVSTCHEVFEGEDAWYRVWRHLEEHHPITVSRDNTGEVLGYGAPVGLPCDLLFPGESDSQFD